MHRKYETCFLANGTNGLFLHIIIHIIIHIFLFQPASAYLRAYFSLKPMGVYFLCYWPGPPCFKSFIL